MGSEAQECRPLPSVGWNPGELQVELSPCLQAREQDLTSEGAEGRPAQAERTPSLSVQASADHEVPACPRGKVVLFVLIQPLPEMPSQTHPEAVFCQLPECPLAQLSGRMKLTITEPSTFLLLAVSPRPSHLGVTSGLTQHTVEGGDPCLASSFCDGRIGGILGFASHAASVTTTQICHCSVKTKCVDQRGSRLPQGVRVATSTEGGA